MKQLFVDEQFIDSNDMDQIPCSVTAEIETDAFMKRQSIVIKKVVMHVPGEKLGEFTDVSVLHLLSEGTIGIMESNVEAAYDKAWESEASA